MEEMLQVHNDHPRRRQKRRCRSFPWGDALMILLAIAICVPLFFSMLQKVPRAEAPEISTAAPPVPEVRASAQPGVPAEESPAEEEGDGWSLVLVNGQNAIPEDFRIDLVEVAGGEQVDRRIYEPLMELLEAAKEGNRDQLPMVVSGYRTRKTQQSLYDNKIAKYLEQGYTRSEAEGLAKQWVAVPGHSEHQIGLAVDINGATYDLYFWLQENSWKYGFIFRYPGDKTEFTGVAEEVWHYRYVGVEAAAEMHEKGLCLEEYLM